MTHVVTVISKHGHDGSVVDEVTKILAGYGRVVGTKPLDAQRVTDIEVVELIQPISEIKLAFAPVESAHGVDVVIQPVANRRPKKLVVFDMDSTLIQQEVIDMIAAYNNIEPEVAAITEAAMNGEIDFVESLKQRVALLKGIDDTVFESLKKDITFTPGAKEVCQALKKDGAKLAVLSGGFIPLARWVKDQLGLDYAFANQLEAKDGKLTGVTQGRVVNSTVKAQLLREIAEKEGVPLANTVAVGDGSNDLEMMGIAGYGVAFNAKPIVQQKAPSKINTGSLQDILYIFGYTSEEQRELLS
ncbi:hypothetical protein TRVA0_039S00386 [Trichomonascus vanleenenianus]|uniref:phosphoserine phosphatase n=1 Tax=Trichomonascus vanleenenianus TaxID=2268995 RepID=UPI003ECA355A